LTLEDRRAFDLRRAPLMRCTLIRRGEGSHRFLWSMHHVLLDGWSLPIVQQQVFALYQAFTRGQELRLESARPYGDYIAWLERQDPARAQAFWTEYLRGFTAPTPLGVDHPSAGDGPARFDAMQ